MKDLSGSTILLADDSESNTLITREILKLLKAEVHVSENGSMAIEALKTNHFDLILMDIQMPVLDGIAATQKIRTFNTLIPIIAFTSLEKNDNSEFSQYGFTDKLSKPSTPEELFNMISRHLTGSR
jgi:CheY-like chemotaxis protein